MTACIKTCIVSIQYTLIFTINNAIFCFSVELESFLILYTCNHFLPSTLLRGFPLFLFALFVVSFAETENICSLRQRLVERIKTMKSSATVRAKEILSNEQVGATGLALSFPWQRSHTHTHSKALDT